MKKALTKKIMLSVLIIIMSITLLQNFSFAKSETVQMIKKSEKEYIIYISSLLNNKFEFAFANKQDKTESELNFYDSALDASENGNNIAYIDENIYNTYFDGKAETFLWVKGTEVKAEKIVLSNALTEETVQELNNVTKRIPVKFGELNLPTETVDGVKITRRMGTINIEDNSEIEYSYKMLKSTQGSKVEELINLATEMNNLDGKNIYDKLTIYSQFKNIYEELKPTDGWEIVKDNIIKQPQDSKDGEQYLVWIKSKNDNDTIIDVQIMTCYDKYTPEYESKNIIEKEVTKMPITGESLTLYIVAVVLILLIVVVTIMKVKNKKSNKNE